MKHEGKRAFFFLLLSIWVLSFFFSFFPICLSTAPEYRKCMLADVLCSSMLRKVRETIVFSLMVVLICKGPWFNMEDCCIVKSNSVLLHDIDDVVEFSIELTKWRGQHSLDKWSYLLNDEFILLYLILLWFRVLFYDRSWEENNESLYHYNIFIFVWLLDF